MDSERYDYSKTIVYGIISGPTEVEVDGELLFALMVKISEDEGKTVKDVRFLNETLEDAVNFKNYIETDPMVPKVLDLYTGSRRIVTGKQ